MTERNLHFDNVAVRADFTRGIPDGIPRLIFVPIDVVIRQVHLNTERVGKKLEGATLIVVGVENNAYKIVVPGRISVAKVGTNLTRLRISGVECDIEVLTILKKIRNRLDSCWKIFARIGFEADIYLGSEFPDFFIKDAINRYLPFCSWSCPMVSIFMIRDWIMTRLELQLR